MLATRLCVATRQNKAKSTGVRSVLSWILDHRTRQFPMCWLRFYAWLHVKIKAKSTCIRGVLSCILDHRARQFLMCWLRVKIKAKGTGVRSILS